MKAITVQQFFKRFPSDDACLTYLFKSRFAKNHQCPKCLKNSTWHLLKSEKAFSCGNCGHHIHPMVDTIFENSSTSLQLWFYAIYLFTTTRSGVMWLPFLGQFSTKKNQNHVQESKKQLSSRI